MEEQSKKWIGLDTFDSVFTKIDWKLGPSCYIKLCSRRTEDENNGRSRN